MKKLILASQSKQRAELLAGLGLEFGVVPADLDEKRIDDADDAYRAELVARAKAEAIHKGFPEAVVIAADTFVLLDGQRLEKPETKNEAVGMLSRLSGREMTVYTGWAYLDPRKRTLESGTVETTLSFRALHPEEIQRYVEKYPVTNWAGGFTLTHAPGLAMVAHIQGSLTSVLGLPIEVLVPRLQASGLL